AIISYDAAGGPGRIVDRRDGDGDGGVSGAVERSADVCASVTVRAGVTEGRCVSETAVVVPGKRAVCRAVDEDRGERIGIYVCVIGQAAQSYDLSLHDALPILAIISYDAAGGPGRIVDRSDGDGDGGVSGA